MYFIICDFDIFLRKVFRFVEFKFKMMYDDELIKYYILVNVD